MQKHGFTLLEMVIVLVVIALTTGGIIFARDMIRNSELRAAIDESQYYIQALNAFKDKYGQMPGDFNTATSIWPAAHADKNTCITTITNLKRTCNGDGSGWIADQLDSRAFFEQFRAWQHLRLAGMIESEITPISSAGADQRKTVGYNIPASKLGGAGWGIVGLPVEYVKANDTLVNYTENDVPPNHVLVLGGNYFDDHMGPAQKYVVTPAEAKSMDNKVDDGRPTLGKMVVQKDWYGYDCSTSDAITTIYNLSAADVRCTPIFKTGL
ncbi:MAG: type II secretion system protein [Alphaproteobacteria bacterium]